MIKLKKRPLLSKPITKVTGSDSEDEQADKKQLPVVPKDFKIPWKKDKAKSDSADFFVLDTVGDADQDVVLSTDVAEETSTSESFLAPAPIPMDKHVQELLDKAVCGPAFEKNYAGTASLVGRRAAKRLRKIEREKNKGRDWFDLPATELTEEAKADLELIQMRSAIDPLAFYRRSDREVLPKYFQIGHVVDAPEDYYSSRLTKKERKKTILDELLYDQNFMQSKRQKFNRIMEREKKKRRGAFQSYGHHKKGKTKPGVGDRTGKSPRSKI